MQRFEFEPFTLELELRCGDARTNAGSHSPLSHRRPLTLQAQLAGELLQQWDANKTVAEQAPPPATRTILARRERWRFQFGKLRRPGTSCKAAAPAIDHRTLPSRTLDEQGSGYVSEASLTLPPGPAGYLPGATSTAVLARAASSEAASAAG